ncbi:MAG: phage Gp37/Gp68 family protein [Parvibaculaceae bacterium]|nr:phage Gp37/Gp68 family protein [Parvibaculaceae bacterium]HBM89442.1 DUF5131 domain-containing protein [Rhodobiaceae bacterium]
MATGSSIEWTDTTWNPVAGCTMVSPGCTNCYAMRMAARLEAMGLDKYQGLTRRSGGRAVWTGKLALSDALLQQPLSWKSSRRVFVNSMSDLFQEGVPESYVRKVWDVMQATPQHQYQILTKRPERMTSVLSKGAMPVLPNVWLGTSVEDYWTASRIGVLKKTPAAVRFLSLEPLLGPVGRLHLGGIDWVIVGGESGPSARPIEASWVDSIHRQCVSQGVAFFFKQWGGTNKKKSGRIYKDKTWDEYPKPRPSLTIAAD